MRNWGYPPYVSVAQKKAKAEKKRNQLKKKNPDLRPVILTGTALARSWWAKSWNKNLERYADYSNRIGRGKSYVRHGAVLDLQIAPQTIRALVLGSAAKPYEVAIDIKPMSTKQWQIIKRHCGDQFSSLQELLAGKFPQSLNDALFNEKTGLFPSPKAITLQCSCPDWAVMCKHVAAALYGVGARFDEDPSLLFTLRGVNIADLVTEAVADKTDELLKKTTAQSTKIIADADLADLFGIDMANIPDFAQESPEIPRQKGKQRAKRTDRQQQPKAEATLSIKKAVAPIRTSVLAAEQVAAIMAHTSEHITIAELTSQTGLAQDKLSSVLYRLKTEGRIQNISPGVYKKK